MSRQALNSGEEHADPAGRHPVAACDDDEHEKRSAGIVKFPTP